MQDDEEREDWEQDPEQEEEVPPDKLRDKWFRDELSFKETVACPACKKELPRETLTCLFCGAKVFYDSGLLGRFAKWIKKLFQVPG